MQYDEPVYMEKRLLAFLRAWPDVPEDLRPSYCWLADAGVLYIDENYDYDEGLSVWPGGLRLSSLGEEVKAYCDAQTMNFWLLPVFLDLLTPEDLANRTPQADAFVRMLRCDWNSRDMRRYVHARLDAGQYTRAAGPEDKSLRYSLAMLSRALDDLIAEIRK